MKYPQFNLENGTVTLPTGLEVYRNTETGDIRYELRTPLHIIIMYNTCGLPNVTNQFFYLSPQGSDYAIYDEAHSNITNEHHHDFFELLIVLKGSLIQEIEGHEYLYPAGSCCLINRNVIHTERFLGEGTILFIELSTDFTQELIDGAHSDFIRHERGFISNDILTFMEENLNTDLHKEYLDLFPAYQGLYEKAGQETLYKLGSKNAVTLHRIINMLVQALFLPRLGAEFTIKSLLYELFDYLDNKEAFHINPIRLRTKNDALLFSRIRHLMEDTHGRISRSQLEEALHYSGNYLNTIVKQFTGMSIFDYGMTFSMKEAARLLSETDGSIAAIIETLHFTNWGHFNQHFRKQFGVNPSKYRKTL